MVVSITLTDNDIRDLLVRFRLDADPNDVAHELVPAIGIPHGSDLWEWKLNAVIPIVDEDGMSSCFVNHLYVPFCNVYTMIIPKLNTIEAMREIQKQVDSYASEGMVLKNVKELFHKRLDVILYGEEEPDDDLS